MLQANPQYVADMAAAAKIAKDAQNEQTRETQRLTGAMKEKAGADERALYLSGLLGVDMQTHTSYLDAETIAAEKAAAAQRDLKAAEEELATAQGNLATAQGQLQAAQQNLYNQLGGMAQNAADKAKQSAERTLEAYKIQDAAFGTHTALTVEKQGEVDAATKEFMNSPQAEADKAAYLARLDEIKAKYAETDESVLASKAKILELQGVIDALTSKTITITTVLRTIYEGSAIGSTAGPTSPMPTSDPGDGYEWHWSGFSWVRRKIKGFASGGKFSAGEVIMVGENGPESVVFGTGGVVLPNDLIGKIENVTNQINLSQAGSVGGPGGRGNTTLGGDTYQVVINDRMAAKMFLDQRRRAGLARAEKAME